MSKTMDRLSKLIAQADNAGTTAEAEAFMEKAMALSKEIGVELAVARAHHASKERELPVADHRVQVNSWSAKPIHRQAMMDLFLAIANSFEVRCLIGGDNYLAFCFGLPSDIEMVEKLFAMLSLQMVSEADQAIKRGDQKKGHYGLAVHGKVYRRHFYQGFTARVGGRLRQQNREAAKRYDETHDTAEGGGAEIVLRDKAKEIGEFYQEKISHMKLAKGGYKGLTDTNEKSDEWSGNATTHGAQAGDRANLGSSDRDLAAGGRALE
jgi:hypothetical protein